MELKWNLSWFDRPGEPVPGRQRVAARAPAEQDGQRADARLAPAAARPVRGRGGGRRGPPQRRLARPARATRPGRRPARRLLHLRQAPRPPAQAAGQARGRQGMSALLLPFLFVVWCVLWGSDKDG